MDNDLKKAIQLQSSISIYRDEVYIATLEKIQEEYNEILKNDLGSKFVSNCGRDLAGEIVRNFFNTSEYHITVDQIAKRMLHFNYDNEYDPIGNNSEQNKNVYNYNEFSKENRDAALGGINRITGLNLEVKENTFDKINQEISNGQEKLFTEDRDKDYQETYARKKYRESREDENGDLYDDLTGKKDQKSQNEDGLSKSELDADHIQARESATYNNRFLKEQAKEELKEFYNSKDNLQLINDSANRSKGDIRVCKVNGKIVYKSTNESDYDASTDITSQATPEQLAEATCSQWEKETDSTKTQTLKDNGYLNEDGKVPKSVKKNLESNIRHSQNAESKVILKNTDYKEVGKESYNKAKAGIGKIIAGQVIYYAAPPIIFEARCILKSAKISIDEAISQLAAAGKRIGSYVFSHLKNIFVNIAENSLKTFIKSFMDILIGMVKATVKKLLKVAKDLVLSVVDSIKVIVTPGATAAEKADGVFNLFGVTITNVILEILFEVVEDGLHIPEMLLLPLEILTRVICTNFVMLVLQKADLFNVRFGFQMTEIEEMFKRERDNYNETINAYSKSTEEEINLILKKVKGDCAEIYSSLKSFNAYDDSVRPILEKINQMFNMNINFESEWQRFLGHA